MSRGDGLNEQALYRKYRSASFEAVIGQPHVVATLTQAITRDRISHAYLFTGPRGVGKTSVARLLARAANCTHKEAAKRPCSTCDNCKVEIGSHLDLIEIDAASNRGIDDARSLREKISSAPSMGRYKVYIIDEVHMLTTEAFNALLKTLEEPPAHAIFILATTEAHKLPETIISRTQRFSFKPIGSKDITAHLRFIADKEKVKIDNDALDLLATASRGGFRDAISLLDQVATSGVSPLTAAEVRRLLGHSDPEILTAITSAVNDGQPGEALAALDKAIGQGVQPGQLATQLIEHWRGELQDLVRNRPEDVSQIRQSLQAIEALLPVMKSSWPELSLEAALVKVATGQVDVPVAAVAPVIRSKQAPAKVAEAQKAKPSDPPVAADGVPDEQLWIKTLSLIKQKNHSLYALLGSNATVRFEGDKVVLGCSFSFHRDRLKEDKNLQVIEQALARVYGRKFKVHPQLEAKPVAAQADNSSELMSSAMEILGGEIIE